MYYPQELIDQIQQNNDIVDVINEYIPLTKKGANYVCLCPFHPDSNPSLTVSRQKQLFKCFACGEGGNVVTFLQKYDGKDFKEAIETLAQRAGIQLPTNYSSEYSKEKQDHKQRLIECNTEAARYFYALLRSEDGKNGLLFESNNDTELAKRMIWAIEHQELAHNLVLRAKQSVQQYQWTSIKDKLFSVYGIHS